MRGTNRPSLSDPATARNRVTAPRGLPPSATRTAAPETELARQLRSVPSPPFTPPRARPKRMPKMVEPPPEAWLPTDEAVVRDGLGKLVAVRNQCLRAMNAGGEIFGLSGDGTRPNRDEANVRLRWMLYALMRRHGLSFPEIARACGLGGHSTIVGGTQRLDEILGEQKGAER